MVEIEEQTSKTMDASEKETTNTTDNNDNHDDNRDDTNDVESKLLSSNGSAPKNGLKQKKSEKSEQDRTTTEEINKLLRDMPLTDDISCGFWIFKGSFFQR